uniref:Uncharacterized protein n=1 Tax=Fagus sylvatica TaxID=28930 RepID=A0A2N9J4S2_FAGSY
MERQLSRFLWFGSDNNDASGAKVNWEQVVYDAASKLDAKLSSVLRDKNWGWSPARSDDLVAIQSKLSLVRLVEEDKSLWIPSKSCCLAILNRLPTKDRML